MSEWQTEVLENLVSTPITYGVVKPGGFLDNGIKLIRGGDVYKGKISQTLRTITPELSKQYQRTILEGGELIVSLVGNPGEVALVPRELAGANLARQVGLVRLKNNIFSNFVLYYLMSPLGVGQLSSKVMGSVQQVINLADLRKVEIQIPPIEEQKAIASVLSSLDDKIDLLHRQNTTLERMAETLFRQWFVEEAQEDWEEGKLGDVSDNVRNSVQAKDIKPTTKYIGLEHIERRNIALKQCGVGEDVSSNKYAFEKNDILFGKLRPYFHKVCFSPFSGICSTDILVIRPKSPDYFSFCLFAYFQNDVVEYANLGSGGTRMPRTDWETLKQYPISLPDKNILLKFNAIVLPSINKITANLTQIQTLEKLRDNLLPKLMSGEVRVSS